MRHFLARKIPKFSKLHHLEFLKLNWLFFISFFMFTFIFTKTLRMVNTNKFCQTNAFCHELRSCYVRLFPRRCYCRPEFFNTLPFPLNTKLRFSISQSNSRQLLVTLANCSSNKIAHAIPYLIVHLVEHNANNSTANK